MSCFSVALGDERQTNWTHKRFLTRARWSVKYMITLAREGLGLTGHTQEARQRSANPSLLHASH